MTDAAIALPRITSRRATLMIMALFFFQPMTFGAWLAAIPYVKNLLDLTKAELALALLGMPLALIPTLQVASAIIDRVGLRKMFAIIMPVQVAAALLPFWAMDAWTLFAALALLGAIIAFMEVALNLYAGRLEKTAGVLIMSRCHGFWALGVMTGSFVMTVLFGWGPVPAMLMIGTVCGVLVIFTGLNLPKLSGDGPEPEGERWPLKEIPLPLIRVALFVLAITMGEGAMTDWAAVYLAERWGGLPEEAGIAVTVFAGMLALGRFTGDWLIGRLGPMGAARVTLACATLGVLCLVAPFGLPVLFAGFALMGLGVSIGFPLGISAAAGLDDRFEAQNIATTAMIGMCGFLVGPPVIGLLAEITGLRVALLLLLPGLILAFAMTKHLSGR